MREEAICQVDDIEIVMSIDHCKTGPLRKSFKRLDIDWLLIEKQYQEWNKLPKTSKDSGLITINITFHYTYTNNSKPARGSTTANQQEAIEARIGDGAIITRGVYIWKAFALM